MKNLLGTTTLAHFVPAMGRMAFDEPNEGGTGGGSTGEGGDATNGNPGGTGGEGQNPAGDGQTGTPATPGEGQQQSGGEPDQTPQGAPETYEGLDFGVELTDEQRNVYLDAFRGQNLTQEQVEAVLTVDRSVAEQIRASAEEQTTQQATEWLEAAQADKEIGGDNWETAQTNAGAALEALGADDAFAEMLDSTGLGNHPILLKAFARIGQILADDVAPGGDPAVEQASTETSWYGDTTPNTKKG